MSFSSNNQTPVIQLKEERQLVDACKSGDRNAQFRLYQQYSRAMYNICLRMVRSDADAEDILQNAFVDVFTKLDSFRYQSTIGAWIKRIVINNCINFLKKRRLDTLQWDDVEYEVHENGDHAFDDESRDEENLVAVKRAMLALPDGYRTVFSLYLLEGYDHAEIGEILGISEATSKSQFSRAKKKLLEMMKEDNI